MTPEEFFAHEMRHPFSWEDGRDCAHTIDRWCVARGWPSFFASSRVDYSTAAEAEALRSKFPMPVWIGRAMRAAGYRRVDEAQVGDVGLIILDGTIACAVRCRLGWVFRESNGLNCFGVNTRVLRAWSY